MKKSYKVKINQGTENATIVDIPASATQPVKVKAVTAAKYLLVDETTGMAPDNIRAKRIGKDLSISFTGSSATDLLITDYYENTVAGFNALIGEAETGVYHAYMPESGEASSMVPSLSEGGKFVGMALGGEQLATGAAAGALIAASGFNPLLAAPLALLGGGGGGSGDRDTTPPKITSAKLASQDDTGVSNSDGITSDNTPRLLVSADADAVSATVTIPGLPDKTYTSTTKNELGQFVVQIPDDAALANGEVTYSVVVKDAAGNVSESFAGTPFVVDKSSDDNYDPAKNPAQEKDLNKGISVQIVSIDADTGVSASDFITSDSTLTFKGAVASTFAKNGDVVELNLLDSTGQVVASQYVEPVNSGGQWAWSWDYSAQKLADGAYTLKAQVVDKAGNAVGAGPIQQNITVDTNALPDANSKFSNAVTGLDLDSGSSATDFLTNQRALSFKGNIGNSNTGFTGKVLVQVLGTDGKIKSQGYVDPVSDGTWSFDNKSQSLGVSGANTQYVLKASVVDLAGNILKSTDQSFTVDLLDPVFTRSGGTTSDGGASYLFSQSSPLTLEAGQKLSNGTFVAAEVGAFTFLNAQEQPVDAPNPSPDGPALSYDPNSLKIVYTDLAGNIFSMTNDKIWIFSAGVTISNVQLSSSNPTTFGKGELAGSIGQYILKTDELTLDLSALHTPSPQAGGLAAINHIGLSGSGAVDNAAHTLKLTTGDVLALGVKNSFISNGRLQVRIDGDSADKVVLDNLLGGSTFEWSTPTNQTLNGSTYLLYSNADLGLDLLIQQAVQITLV